MLEFALRSRDEEHDAEHVLPARQAQDGVHPGPHPLEAVGAGDRPDEQDAARAGRAVVRAAQEPLDVHDVVRDADAAGEEDGGAVAVERVRAAVGAFDEAGGGEDEVLGLGGALVEFAGEAVAGAADEGDLAGLGRRGGGEDFGFEFREGEVCRGGGFVGPRDGEGVRGPVG